MRETKCLAVLHAVMDEAEKRPDFSRIPLDRAEAERKMLEAVRWQPGRRRKRATA